MADVDPISRKNNKNDFTQAITSEKHERVARQTLYDLIVFHQAVESEMQQMLDGQAKGKGFDADLFERMTVVKEKYKQVMTGFLELDDNSQRHAMISLADAVQDLMKYIHMRRNA